MKTTHLATLIIACAYVILATQSQAQSTQLEKRRITLSIKERPLAVVVKQLTVDHDIPIGFEESELDRGHDDFWFEVKLPPPSVTRFESSDGRIRGEIFFQQTFPDTLRKFSIEAIEEPLNVVLDQLVRQMRNYRWKIRDGVVNIFPKTHRDRVFKKLLRTKVKSFAIRRPSVLVLKYHIARTPEIASFLRGTGSKLNTTQSGFMVSLHRKLPRDIRFSNLTVLQILNRITVEKRGGWILRWSRHRKPQEAWIDIDI